MKFFRKKSSLNPPADVPLTDTPGKLLSVRTDVVNNTIAIVETKWNMEEYERLKPLIKRIMK